MERRFKVLFEDHITHIDPFPLRRMEVEIPAAGPQEAIEAAREVALNIVDGALDPVRFNYVVVQVTEVVKVP